MAEPGRVPDEFDPFASRTTRRRGMLDRRREKIVSEIERNRRGEYKVPTWALFAGIVAIILFWTAIILFT